MKRSTSFVPSLLVFCMLISNSHGISQTGSDFNGLWRTKQDVLVQITHTGSAIIVKYLNPGACPTGRNCVLGGGAEYYLKGTVGTNNKMDLTMLRCTHSKAMREDGLSDYWTSPCKVTSVTDKSIAGTSRIEWYLNDYKDGKEVNFRREISKDYDESFSLTRTNCKEELERVVFEVDQKAQSYKEQVIAANDVSKSSKDALNRLGEETRDQIKEEVFHTVVPPPLRVVTIDPTEDAPGFIEGWADLVKDLGESGGKIALETVAWGVLIGDMLIDLANLNAKGLVTIQETGQIHNELQNMRDRMFESQRSWLYSIRELNNLSDLCAGEIPKDKQPKSINSTITTSPEDLIKYEAEAKRIHSAIGTDIESAQSAMTTTIASIESLQQFLEPYKIADKNKTLKAVMQTAGVSKFQNGLIEIGNNWIKVLRAINGINEKFRQLKAIPGPTVG